MLSQIQIQTDNDDRGQVTEVQKGVRGKKQMAEASKARGPKRGQRTEADGRGKQSRITNAKVTKGTVGDIEKSDFLISVVFDLFDTCFTS